MSIVCPNRYGLYSNSWYIALAVYCVLLWSQQLWITLNRNDVSQLAIYQIIAFFVENKNAVKINNLIVARWYNILCKSGGVKWRNCYQHSTLTSGSCLYTRVYWPRKLASEQSVQFQLTFQCWVLSNRSCIVRRSKKCVLIKCFD